MTRLMRTLTVVLGALMALGGGAVVLVRGNSRHPTYAAAVGSASPPGTSATTAAADGNAVTPPAAPPAPAAGSTAPPPQGTTAANPPTTPFPPTTSTPLTALASALDTALAGSNSCLVVQDGAGRALYEHQPDAALIPASTQKLLVAAAALTTLGPDFRFTTRVVAPAAPANGTVAGLWLVGDGDPLLATPEFIASSAGRARMADFPWTPFGGLAEALAGAGVKLVTGGIRGDDSYEDRLRFLPVWPASYQQQNQVGLLSALSVNEGVQYTPPKPILAPDPPAYAASELARLLQLRHLAIGSAADQVAPAGAVVVASVSSAPLRQIVEAMLRASDNWVAELLVRAIDKASGGTGTTAGGTAVVLRDAAQAGIPLAGVQMDDGSGLSRTNRATCRELLAALDLGNQPAYAPLLAGLAVAGQTGTLAGRYRGTPLAGKLRAKTGSLTDAGGMVGVVAAPSTVYFSFLNNDAAPEDALFAKEDAVAAALAAYSGRG